MPPSSSGSGHLSFKETTGIRLPLGPKMELILPGSMPERLMGTDCKFVGNMSTLVQIQLGPKIRSSIMR
ncbi:G2/M phase-specific E3 ubiquitin-protein ligase [Bienertia sinuspersici]